MSDPPPAAPIPIVDSEALTADDKRLLARLDKLEDEQIGFLDDAGKRLVELSTLMLGLLFAIVGFGDKFPPKYLERANHPFSVWLLLLALFLYLGTLACGLFAIQPRPYARYSHNLTRNRGEIEKITAHKLKWFQAGSWLLAIASLMLALLVTLIVLGF